MSTDAEVARNNQEVTERMRDRIIDRERLDGSGPRYNPSSGKLTYDSAVNILRSGGSIIHDGKSYTSIDQLPSPSDWASTPEERARAKDNLDKEITRLSKLRDEANAADGPKTAEVKQSPTKGK